MLNLKILSVICGIELVGAIGNVMGVAAANEILLGGTCLLAGYTVYLGTENFQKKTCPECKSKIRKAYRILNRSPSSRQLKKYKFFLPVEIYLLAVFMQLASKFRVFPLVLKFRDSFVSVYCYSNLYNLRSFLREYLYQ